MAQHTDQIKLDSITPNKANESIIKDDSYAKLMASIKEDAAAIMENHPLLTDMTGEMLGRSKHLEILKELGYTHVPANWVLEVKDRVKLSKIKPNPNNPRFVKDDKFFKLVQSLEDFGPKMLPLRPIIIDGHVLGGNMRTKALRELGYKEIPATWVMFIEGFTEAEKKEFVIKDNLGFGEWDFEILKEEWDLGLLDNWGMDMDWADGFDGGYGNEGANSGALFSKFIIPPFSVLDTKQGSWVDRKNYWKALINDNGESREGALSESELMGGINSGVSILDPVLAEIANMWFCPPSGKTFDCFAGDSVFGVVSDSLGHQFIGIELRQEQVDLNNSRLKGSKSKYICSDGQDVTDHVQVDSQDMLFSCPPYFDLEIYSDLPNDASNQGSYSEFMDILKVAFNKAIKCLKADRFAFIVVGDIRCPKGFYRGFPDDIKHIFREGGMNLYNEMILVEKLGTLPQRVGRYMRNRKVGKCHQNILVFYKGDPKTISTNFPELDFRETFEGANENNMEYESTDVQF